MATLTPKQAAAHFRRAAAAVLPAVITAEQQTVKEALASAVQMSSGPNSAAQLKAAGHPYSRQRPNPAYDAAIINAQSGSFRAAWQPVPPVAAGNRLVCGVVNRDRAAQYMSGTRLMIARGVAAAVQKSVQAARLFRLRAVLRHILAP